MNERQSGGSHQKVIFSNRHGRLGCVIIPRVSRHSNWQAKRNSIADLRRQLGMLPGENGGYRHGGAPSAPNPRSIANIQAIKRAEGDRQCLMNVSI
jgi:hypothetical protein